MNKLKNIKGITLIVLVITIIALLILAGISLNMITSQDGILSKAAKVNEKQKQAEEKEKDKILELDNLIEYETIETVTDISKLKDPVIKMTKYIDSNKKEAIIPKGFKISSNENENNNEQQIDKGLVIVDQYENEFVWVPVSKAIDDGKTIEIGTNTPMARKIGNTENYQGILYNLNASNQEEMKDYGVGTTIKYREPSLITGNENDTSAILTTIIGNNCDADQENYKLAGYNSAEEFGRDMQEEYNNIVKSIEKYGGFYIGRYETGIENEKAVSKNASIDKNKNKVITAQADKAKPNKTWYWLYNKQKTMAKDNGLENVGSSMIWGSQYDAMMLWMQNTSNDIGLNFTKGVRNTTSVTGSKSDDIINNVYDLYGCHLEWTLEANNTESRVFRGGDMGVDSESSPSRRTYTNPTSPSSRFGTRCILYIK